VLIVYAFPSFLLSFAVCHNTHQVLVLRWTAEAVFRIFDVATSTASGASFLSTLIPFRDASVGPSTFGMSVLDCWKSLIKANSCGFFDLDSFDPNE
jgi:hypothetical protein